LVKVKGDWRAGPIRHISPMGRIGPIRTAERIVETLDAKLGK
jgi:hypothetical protein